MANNDLVEITEEKLKQVDSRDWGLVRQILVETPVRITKNGELGRKIVERAPEEVNFYWKGHSTGNYVKEGRKKLRVILTIVNYAHMTPAVLEQTLALRDSE